MLHHPAVHGLFRHHGPGDGQRTDLWGDPAGKLPPALFLPQHWGVLAAVACHLGHLVRTLLEEAVYNVCDNAIKYNRNDGSVSVFLTQTAQEIQIVVKDTGVGIPKEDQDRVFERFYRVDKSRSKEIGGTGLGLSIVKHAVGALKGSVMLRSEEGNGTEICMKFPKVYKE